MDYNSALGLVTSAAEGAYEDTGKTIDLEGLRTLLRQSSEAGHTARAQVNVALDKKGSLGKCSCWPSTCRRALLRTHCLPRSPSAKICIHP